MRGCASIRRARSARMHQERGVGITASIFCMSPRPAGTRLSLRARSPRPWRRLKKDCKGANPALCIGSVQVPFNACCIPPRSTVAWKQQGRKRPGKGEAGLHPLMGSTTRSRWVGGGGSAPSLEAPPLFFPCSRVAAFRSESWKRKGEIRLFSSKNGRSLPRSRPAHLQLATGGITRMVLPTRWRSGNARIRCRVRGLHHCIHF